MTSPRSMIGPSIRHRGPPLWPLALVHGAFLVAGILAVTAFARVGSYPSPFDDHAQALEFFLWNGTAMRFRGFFLLASALPLGLFVATAASRLRFLGARGPGESIAWFGGIGAALALMLSGVCTWALGDPLLLPSGDVLRVLHLGAFVLGGPMYVASFGLFAAGASVTTGLRQLLPRWVVGLGLAVAITAELSTLVLLLPALAPLVPIVQLGVLVWLVAVAVLLPRTRPVPVDREPLAHPGAETWVQTTAPT